MSTITRWVAHWERVANSHQALIDALDAMVDANPTPRTQEAQAAYEQAVAALKLARGDS